MFESSQSHFYLFLWKYFTVKPVPVCHKHNQHVFTAGSTRAQHQHKLCFCLFILFERILCLSKLQNYGINEDEMCPLAHRRVLNWFIDNCSYKLIDLFSSNSCNSSHGRGEASELALLERFEPEPFSSSLLHNETPPVVYFWSFHLVSPIICLISLMERLICVHPENAAPIQRWKAKTSV